MPHAALPPVLRQRARFAAGLLGLAGASLALTAGCASVSLDEPLEGTPWRLVQLDGRPVALASIDSQAEPHLQFDAERRQISGLGGCNRLSGGYRREGHALRIGPVASTRMACADTARMAVETRFVAVLEATAGFDLKGEQLTLLDSRSLPLAVLELGLRKAP
ncbi:MAG: protein of unknown function Meta and HslJ [Variovorax sp.]|nr:protein of unknown function Meta and HslJ [Variovorax sp.]